MRFSECIPKQIYAMLADNGKVKVGVSNNVLTRKEAIERAVNVTIIKVYTTQKIKRSIAFQLESKIIKKLGAFLDEKNGREWFDVSFEDAIKTIECVLKESGHQNARDNYYIYKFLVVKMVELDISFNDLSEAVGMSVKVLRQCLIGEREFRLTECVKIRNFLAPELTLDELFATETKSV